MIEFIHNNVKNQQKSFKELMTDLKRIAILQENNLAFDLQNNISVNWDEFISNKDQINSYKKAVESLTNVDEYLSIYSDAGKNKEKKKNELLIADFFAGCGGLSEGFIQAGYKVEFINEINETFSETNYLNHKTGYKSYYVGDIGYLHKNSQKMLKALPELDVVCGGPPCQGFSIANRQPLINDPRNRLYKDYLIVLSILRPKFFLIENVRGMANKIDDISNDIKKYLGSEYNFSYAFLNASDYGAPQKRTRFFLIANRIGINPDKVFAQMKSNTYKPVLSDALINLPALGPKTVKNKSGFESDTIGYKIRNKNNNLKLSLFEKNINNNRIINFILNHQNRYNNERDIKIFTKLPQGCNSLHKSIKDIMPYSSRNHIFKDKYFKLNENNLCKTITAHMRLDCNMYIHPTQSRGLSPREAARIQTFPDNYFFRGTPNQWYTQIGNAVSVKLAKSLALSIKSLL